MSKTESIQMETFKFLKNQAYGVTINLNYLLIRTRITP